MGQICSHKVAPLTITMHDEIGQTNIISSPPSNKRIIDQPLKPSINQPIKSSNSQLNLSANPSNFQTIHESEEESEDSVQKRRSLKQLVIHSFTRSNNHSNVNTPSGRSRNRSSNPSIFHSNNQSIERSPSSLAIEHWLRIAERDEKLVIKCLVLGSGGCGKSTLLKQMRMIYGTGFPLTDPLNNQSSNQTNHQSSNQSNNQSTNQLSPRKQITSFFNPPPSPPTKQTIETAVEMRNFALVCRRNTLDSIICLLDAADQFAYVINIIDPINNQTISQTDIDFLREFYKQYCVDDNARIAIDIDCAPVVQKVDYTIPEPIKPSINQSINQTINHIFHSSALSPAPILPHLTLIPQSIIRMIDLLYHSRIIQTCNQRQNEFYLMDSGNYFLQNCVRILSDDYYPTSSDIIRSRTATRGIVESNFTMYRQSFRLIDVGGQRGERKKWIHSFDAVTAIIFVASLSEYDQFLEEDPARNRMKESLDLFSTINALPWFSDVPIILFLNKADIFAQKCLRYDIGVHFPQYTGGTNIENGLKFIQNEFFARNLNKKKSIYCHVTDATNTENIEFVWKDTKSIILKQLFGPKGEGLIDD